MELKKITPRQAQKWLDASTAWAKEHPEQRNRRVSKARVRRLIVAIKANEWQATNQGIMIGKDGVIIDGQHRLAAIAEAGIPCEAYVLQRPDLTSPIDVAVDIDGAARGKFWVLGVKRADFEVANMILELAAASPTRATITYKGAFPRAVMRDASEFVGTIGLTAYKARAYSQVPVRVGAALAWIEQLEAVDQYAALVGQRHGVMWPIVGHLGSWLSSSMLQGQRLNRRNVVAKAYKAFRATGAGRDRGMRQKLGKYDIEHSHRAAVRFLDEAGIDLAGD